MKRLQYILQQDYILAVVAFLSLQQAFFAEASLEQQECPFAHFFFLPLSVFANAIPATSKTAEENKITFFIMLFCVCLINVKIELLLHFAKAVLLKLQRGNNRNTPLHRLVQLHIYFCANWQQ